MAALLHQELKNDPQKMVELSRFVMKVRHGRDAVRALGLSMHPCLRTAEKVTEALAWRVVYHADPFTKYTMSPPPVSFDADRAPAPVSMRDAAGCGALADDEALRHHYMLEHLNAHNVEHMVFSMPLERNAFHTLTSVLHGLPSCEELALEDVAGSVGVHRQRSQLHGVDYLDHPPAVGKTLSNMIFWRVVSNRVARVKRPRGHGVRGLDLSFHSAVSLHQLIDVSVETKRLVISADAANRGLEDGHVVPVLFSPAALDEHQLMQVKVWRLGHDEDQKHQPPHLQLRTQRA